MTRLISILFVTLFSVLLGNQTRKAHSGEPTLPQPFTHAVAKPPDKRCLPDAITECLISAIRRRKYSFFSEDKLNSLRNEMRSFVARYQPTDMSASERETLLAAIEQYVPEYFLNRALDHPRHFRSDFDIEGAYLKFPDQIQSFKWKLWLALTRKPATSEQIKCREAQHSWLRQYIADVPMRPGDTHPIGVGPDGVPTWASAYVQRKLADPLSLLYDPMTDNQFEVFKKLMVRSAANGLVMTVSDIPVRALGARAHRGVDVEKAYSYPFDIELPFQDEVLSIWGGGGGAGSHLAFASNALFRGRDVFLDGRKDSRHVFDLVRGMHRLTPEMPDESGDTLMAQWVRKHDTGDVAYDDSQASLIALRVAKIAELEVSNWFEADRVTNRELRKLIDENGQAVISVKRLPPVNGLRQVGVTEPRFFVVVQSCQGRLAVMDLRTREFGQIHIVSRLRSADLTTSRPAMKCVP